MVQKFEAYFDMLDPPDMLESPVLKQLARFADAEAVMLPYYVLAFPADSVAGSEEG